jgi:AcrR family transcriptional regulator
MVALRADAAHNRALVLDAARRLFASRGLDVSMQEIANEAGVGIGTVFRRFPTKDALIATMLEEGIGQQLELVRSAVERSGDEPWEAFVDYVMRSTELLVAHRGLMEAIGSARVANPMHCDVRCELMDHLRLLVERAQRAGVLRADIVAEDIPAMQCAISRTSRMPMATLVPESWRRCCSVYLDGLRADGACTPLQPSLLPHEQVVAAITSS